MITYNKLKYINLSSNVVTNIKNLNEEFFPLSGDKLVSGDISC